MRICAPIYTWLVTICAAIKIWNWIRWSTDAKPFPNITIQWEMIERSAAQQHCRFCWNNRRFYLWFYFDSLVFFFSNTSVVSDVCFRSLVVMMKFTHYRLWRFSTTALPSLFLDICVRKKPNLRSSSTAYLESTQITAQTKPQMNHQFNQLGQYLRHQYAPTPLNDDIPRLKPTHFNRNENRNAYILYKCVRLSFCLSSIKQELFFITILIATMRTHKNCNLIYFFES